MEQIYPFLPGIALAYSAFLLGIFSPGPNIMAVIGTSMEAGRKSGISLALGVATGSLLWAILAAVGLSALLSTYASALFFIKLFGGAYLLWLAYKSFKAATSSGHLQAKELEGGKRSNWGYALRGFIIQMTNPKAALAWVAIISLGLAQDAPIWVAGIIIGGTFILSIAMHVTYAVAFSTPVMVRAYSKARRYIQATLGAFFTFAGIKLLTDRG